MLSPCLRKKQLIPQSGSLPTVLVCLGFFAFFLLACGFVRFGSSSTSLNSGRSHHTGHPPSHLPPSHLVRRQNASDTTSTYEFCRFWGHSNLLSLLLLPLQIPLCPFLPFSFLLFPSLLACFNSRSYSVYPMS